MLSNGGGATGKPEADTSILMFNGAGLAVVESADAIETEVLHSRQEAEKVEEAEKINEFKVMNAALWLLGSSLMGIGFFFRMKG